MQTIEAAEALLNMDSPGPMLDEKRISKFFPENTSNLDLFVKEGRDAVQHSTAAWNC